MGDLPGMAASASSTAEPDRLPAPWSRV